MMPFEGGVDNPGNATFIFSCAAALLYGTMAAAPPRFMVSVVKTLAVALLAVLAGMQGGHWLLVVALGLSAVGDLFLSREGEGAFLAGLSSFLAAHLAYIALFAVVGGGFEALLVAPWRATLAACLAVFGLGMFAMLYRRVGPPLRLPIAAYVVAIIAMGTLALTLDAPLVIAGALLFITSDTLLAAEKFLLPAISPHRGWMKYTLWALYYLGQLSITLGLIRF